MAKAVDGVFYDHLPKITLEEAHQASLRAVGALLRLHGLDEAPEDSAHVFWDQLDLVLRELGLHEALVSPWESPLATEESA